MGKGTFLGPVLFTVFTATARHLSWGGGGEGSSFTNKRQLVHVPQAILHRNERHHEMFGCPKPRAKWQTKCHHVYGESSKTLRLQMYSSIFKKAFKRKNESAHCVCRSLRRFTHIVLLSEMIGCFVTCAIGATITFRMKRYRLICNLKMCFTYEVSHKYYIAQFMVYLC